MHYKSHILEIKQRLSFCIIFYIASCAMAYVCKDYLYAFITKPLLFAKHELIFTGVADAFLAYLSMSMVAGLCLSLPIMCYHAYAFISPGLYKKEKNVAFLLLSLSPALFIVGGVFVLYIVMPKALDFFISFEKNSTDGLKLILQPKIDEYLKITIQLMFAFGLAFQMPIILIILCLLNIVTVDSLRLKRRIAIVLNFILAGFLTPPDILSQFLLAIPLVFLYEIAIISSMILTKK